MTDCRIGVVGIPGKWSTEVLADAVEAETGFRLVVDMAQVCLDTENQKLMYAGQDLCQLDALIIKKISREYDANTIDRLELLRVPEMHGVRVFSRSEKVLRLVNRLSCTVTLNNHRIPMPPTLITESQEEACQWIKQMGSAILKPLFSTKARGMIVIDEKQSQKSIRASLTAFKKKNPMMYLQKQVNLPGRDLGLIFLGGEYVGAYARVGNKDAWNTTILSGGKYQSASPSKEIIDIARRAQAPFEMDFTTVDIAETNAGPVVFEVSAFGGFKGALEGAGIDAASMYVDYVLTQITQSELS